jgi:hypothetical protein
MACRRANCPTRRSPLSVNAATEGVVRAPSAFGMTTGEPASIVAMTELVVPRSMPTAFATALLRSWSGTPPVLPRLSVANHGEVTYPRDPRVDAYIDALPDWQQAICREVRDLVHAADPEVAETVKRTVQPYFVLQGNICALLAAKTHVNVFLYDGAIVPDPDGIITAGHDNKTARTVAVHQGGTVPARPLSAMFRQIIANNRAGGWRKLKGS